VAIQNSALNANSAGRFRLSAGTGAYTFDGITGGATALATVINTNYNFMNELVLNPQGTTSNTYNGVIANGAANMKLTKTGTGTQILGGENTYTGATSIEEGTLVINGASTLTTGALTVAADARLGGNGSTPAAVTLEAGGKWLVGISDWTGSAGTGFTDLTVGSLTLDGAWTLDVTSLTAYANFAEANKTFPILTATGGITGFNAGNVTVVAHDSFAGVGSWSVAKNGDTLELVYTAEAPPIDDYAAWDGQYPDDDLSDPAADNDGDGMSNFQEYAFGLDPTSGASVNPITDISAFKTTGIFTYARRVGSGLNYSVYLSTNLQLWDIQESVTEQQVGLNEDEDVETIEVEINGFDEAYADESTLFLRVKAD